MIPQPSIKICASNLPCPASGIWESMGNFKTTCVVAKGNKMPEYAGTIVFWKMLVEE